VITEPQKLFLAFKCWLANQVQVQVRVTRLTSWPRVDSSIPKTPSDCWQTHEKKIHVHTILTHSTILVMWNASACVLKRPCNGYNGATTQQRDNDEATKQRSNDATKQRRNDATSPRHRPRSSSSAVDATVYRLYCRTSLCR